MNVLVARSFLPGLAIALCLLAPAAVAQNIYKCPQPGGGVAYTDYPCPSGNGELLHQADDSEVIDRYLRLGQEDLARQYADARDLDTLYEDRLTVYQQAQEDKARRRHEEALAAQQRKHEEQRQALLDHIADRNRLEAENNALRQQNDQYRDELSRPVLVEYAPVYWGGTPAPYPRRPHHDHYRDPGSRWTPPKGPVYHPCTQLAGGRVKC